MYFIIPITVKYLLPAACTIGSCVSCSSATQCDECDTGYSVALDGSCAADCDIEGCVSCDAPNNCADCDDGLVMSGGACAGE